MRACERSMLRACPLRWRVWMETRATQSSLGRRYPCRDCSSFLIGEGCKAKARGCERCCCDIPSQIVVARTAASSSARLGRPRKDGSDAAPFHADRGEEQTTQSERRKCVANDGRANRPRKLTAAATCTSARLVLTMREAWSRSALQGRRKEHRMVLRRPSVGKLYTSVRTIRGARVVNLFLVSSELDFYFLSNMPVTASTTTCTRTYDIKSLSELCSASVPMGGLRTAFL